MEAGPGQGCGVGFLCRKKIVRGPWAEVPCPPPHGMRCSRAWCGTPPILGVVNMVGTRNFTCYMGALCSLHVSFARYCPFCTFCDLVFWCSNYLVRGSNGVRALVIAWVIAR